MSSPPSPRSRGRSAFPPATITGTSTRTGRTSSGRCGRGYGYCKPGTHPIRPSPSSPTCTASSFIPVRAMSSVWACIRRRRSSAGVSRPASKAVRGTFWCAWRPAGRNILSRSWTIRTNGIGSRRSSVHIRASRFAGFDRIVSRDCLKSSFIPYAGEVWLPRETSALKDRIPVSPPANLAAASTGNSRFWSR